MQIWKWEKKIALLLKEQDNPVLCARMLMRWATGFTEMEYLLALREEFSENDMSKLLPALERRLKGEPMAYILGKKEFYGHEFIVSPATLVPRPETELLVDLALSLTHKDNLCFADIGCGSACIGISLELARPDWKGYFIDKSIDALGIALLNGEQFCVPMTLLQAELEKLPFKNESLDLIISNPPYIDPELKEEVMREVLAFEPHIALFSENGGLFHITNLLREAGRVLRPGGRIIMEHAYDQKESSLRIFQEFGFINICDYDDLASLPRCATGVKAF